MQHPDEGMIHTWLDGELSPEESAALQEHAATCQQCADTIAEARGLVAASSRIVSALDAVPRRVIPVAKPQQKAWYDSTQIRVAAAVLVVAGASLLLLKNETQKSEIAPARSIAKKTAPAVTAAAAAKTLAPRVPVVARRHAVLQPAAKDELRRGAGIAAASSERVAFGKVLEQNNASDAARSKIAAAGDIAGEPRLIRTDSMGTGTQSIYQTASGVRLILTEFEPLGFSAKAVSPTMDRKATAELRNVPLAANPAAPPSPNAGAAIVNTITWMDAATGRRYSLTGPISVAELESVKARLQQTKR